MGRFDGKLAVVTGGRGGIGRACALALREAGATVAVIAKSKDRGDLPLDGIAYIQADLSRQSDRMNLIPYKFMKVDILVNNAGISYLHPALEYPEDERREVWEVNYHAAVDLACQAVRLGCKRIINIASISGRNGARNISEYAASKAALIQWTKCASNEWAPQGVTVNCISPGFIQTDMLVINKENIGRIPVGRVGTPEEVARFVMDVLQNEYITGADLLIDGGFCGR